MKVRCVGISFENKYSAINFDNIFDYLEKNSKIIETPNYQRHFFFFKQKDEYCGLVLTFKDQKKDCRASINKDKFKIKLEDLKDQKLATFNFFVLKKSKENTLKGIFLYYHNSCSPTSLSDFIRSSINVHIENLKKEELRNIEKEKEKEKKAIRKKYHGSLIYSVIVEQSELKTLLRSLKEINKVEMNLESYAFRESQFTPIVHYAKNAKLSLNIDKSNSNRVNDVIEGISEFCKDKANYRKGKVSGIDKNGYERFIDFVNCPTFFAEFDYDILSENVDELDETNYKINEIYNIIRKEMNENKKYFK